MNTPLEYLELTPGHDITIYTTPLDFSNPKLRRVTTTFKQDFKIEVLFGALCGF